MTDTIDESHGRLQELFGAIDGQDADRFVSFLTPEASFRFGSAPAVTGRSTIAEAVRGFFATIAGCRHRLANTWAGDETLVCEGEVTYRRHDGSEITLPFVNVFGMEGELIADYKIYVDIGPLYSG
jgi:limonene-1,2-epoxide hydrolase